MHLNLTRVDDSCTVCPRKNVTMRKKAIKFVCNPVKGTDERRSWQCCLDFL